jgi:hypothetical protein
VVCETFQTVVTKVERKRIVITSDIVVWAVSKWANYGSAAFWQQNLCIMISRGISSFTFQSECEKKFV